MNETVESINQIRNLLCKEGKDPEEFFPTCVGCGYCCLQATCSLGVEVYGTTYPCPALLWKGKQYRCKLANEYEDILYIGSGCCSPLNSWRKDVKERNFR